jgi:hypothetical protein
MAYLVIGPFAVRLVERLHKKQMPSSRQMSLTAMPASCFLMADTI